MQNDSSSPQAPAARHTAALVLFSGGQDSTTCLAQALSLYERVETLGFDYGQRHSVEMQVRQQVRERLSRDFTQWAPRLGDDHVIEVRGFDGGNAVRVALDGNGSGEARDGEAAVELRERVAHGVTGP